MSASRRTRALGVLVCLMMTPKTAVPADPAPWPDPVANDVVPSETAGITHGPHLGAVTASSARVWVRTASPTEFSVVVDDRLPLSAGSRRFKGATTKEQDHCGSVELSGLAVGRRYYYGIEIDGVLADSRVDFHDPWPSFRTLPDSSTCRDDLNNPRGLFNICFSVACCGCQDPTHSGGQYGSTPAFDTLLRTHGAEPMFHIFNGDTIYEELRDGTLDGVRNNYKLYYSRGRSLTRLLRSIPGFFLYNDHEIGNDIQGSGDVGKGAGPQLLRDVALQAWTEYCGWANPPQPQRGTLRFGNARISAGSDILEDAAADFSTLRPETVSTLHIDPFVFQRPRVTRHVPARNAGVYGVKEILGPHRLRVTPAWSHDEQVAYSIGTHHYYDWIVGNCHFFALDTRGERSRLNTADVHDPASFILGAAQKKWLVDNVRSTAADFVFVISPDPWVIYHTGFHGDPTVNGRKDKGDGFASFVHEREELLEFFSSTGKPVLIFSGDVHNSMSVQISPNVWEFLCGPVGSTAHPIGTAGGMPFGGWFDSQGRNVKVKWVGGFPDNVPYSRLRQTYYAIVQVNNIMQSARPEGAGYQFLPYQAPQVVVRFHDGYTGRLVYAEAVSTLDSTAEPQRKFGPARKPDR